MSVREWVTVMVVPPITELMSPALRSRPSRAEGAIGAAVVGVLVLDAPPAQPAHAVKTKPIANAASALVRIQSPFGWLILAGAVRYIGRARAPVDQMSGHAASSTASCHAHVNCRHRGPFGGPV